MIKLFLPKEECSTWDEVFFLNKKFKSTLSNEYSRHLLGCFLPVFYPKKLISSLPPMHKLLSCTLTFSPYHPCTVSNDNAIATAFMSANGWLTATIWRHLISTPVGMTNHCKNTSNSSRKIRPRRRQLILTDKSQTNAQQVGSILSCRLTEKLPYSKRHDKYVKKKKLSDFHSRMNERVSEYIWHVTNYVVEYDSHCSVTRYSNHDDYYDLCTKTLRNNNIIRGSSSSLV